MITSFSALLVWVISSIAVAAPVSTPHATVELVAESEAIQSSPTGDGGQARDGVWVGVRFQLEPHWHIYWINAGDSGKAPEFKWTLPAGFEAGGIEWPVPSRILVGPLVNFGYEGTVLLMTRIQFPKRVDGGSSVDLELAAKWLICADVCIPAKANLKLKLPTIASAASSPEPSAHKPLFDQTRALLPKPMPADWVLKTEVGQGSLALQVSSPTLAFKKDPVFFPFQSSLLDYVKKQEIQRGAGTLKLTLPKAEDYVQPEALEGLLVSGDDDKLAYTVSAPLGSGGLLGQALLFAFLGGLILNLMPCVFPVLFIKALSLVHQAHENKRRIRLSGLFYQLGILVAFWILAGALIALRKGGESLGWGFQLQSPLFIMSLAGLLFMMGLNLLGVFEIEANAGLGNKLASRDGYAGSFFTGVLATVVATPCTAPFMGTALGFALSQPPLTALAVFSALGLGLGLPYVAISFTPVLARILPKPGRWMETFKHAMAFPILATVIWLVWVLGVQGGVNGMVRALAALLVLGIAAWFLGRWRTTSSRVIALVLIIAALRLGTVGVGAPQISWEVYSRARLAQLLELGRPVFVDFTAAWCVTCKVNEAVALETASVAAKIKEKNVVMVRADWTQADPEITQALAEFGRNGVPLYVLYSGKRGDPPRVLPQILTSGMVVNELEKLNP